MPAGNTRLQAWIADWAAWHENASDYANAYSSSTPQYRAMMAQRITEFTTCIPRGAEPPRGLARLCLVMTTLKDLPEHARNMTIVQRFYIIQHYHGAGTECAELCAAEYNRRPSTIYEYKRDGERAIEQRLRES